MKKSLWTKCIALGVTCAVAASLIPANDLYAASAEGNLPVAGIARALNEGKSVTAIRAEQVKKTGTVSEKYIEQVAASAATNEKPEIKPEKSIFGTSVYAAEEDEEKGEAEVSSNSKPEGFSGTIVIREESVSNIDEVLTAGAGSTKEKEEETKEEEKKHTVSSEGIDSVTAGAESSTDTTGSDGSMNLVDAVTSASAIKTEDFTNLVIARVDDYVNVRQMPTEESEIVGKLYNKSVGDELEDAGDWVKIKSGNTVGYVKKEYVVRGEEAKDLAQEVGTRMAKVITTTLYVRKDPSRDAEVIGMVPMDDELTVSEETDDGWVKVSVEEGDGYVSAEFVQLFTDFVRAESKQEEEARLKKEEEAREAARRAAAEAEKKNRKNNKNNNGTGSKSGSSSKGSGGGSYAASGSGTGASVANYALQFVGNPYVYGGSSLTNGTDCSGFVMSVYRNFGVSLPHSSGGDRSVGSAVQGGLANAQAGDIVCYSGHVGIYIGGGQIVHASTARTGIKVSSANYRTPLAVRRIF